MSLTSRPTRVRYLLIGVAALASVLLYLDRFCISFAEVYIRQDLGLTKSQAAWMLSAFFWTYALAQVPSGFLADRYGPRLMLTAYVLGWSLFTGLTGLATGFVSLLLLRACFGMAQAGAYPTAASLVGRWMPISGRGGASGIIALGGRVGGFLAPLATAALILAFVPPSTSPRLVPGDVLDAAAVIERLQADDGPAYDSLRAALPDGFAAQWPSDGLSEQEASRFAVAFTEHINDRLTKAAWFDEADFTGIDVAGEGRLVWESDPERLRPAQVARTNRLLVEALFPVGVRKLYTAAWRPVMLTFGLVGLPIALLCWIVLRDRPEDHSWANAGEVEYLRSGGAIATEGSRKLGIPWRGLLTNRSLWLLCISQVGTNLGWAFLVTWLPRYLQEVHAVPIERRAVLASIPLFVGWFGMLSGGWLTDRLVLRFGLRWGRALPLVGSRLLAMTAYILCLFLADPILITVLFGVVAFATDLGSPAMWAFNQDIGGRQTASVLGWGNMWGNLGAAVSPVLLDALVGEQLAWDRAFLACAIAFGLSGIAVLGVDASRPLQRNT